MAYIGLGSRRAVGAVDQTGNNPGKWTIAFTPAQLNVNVPQYEVYKIVVHGAVNSSFTVYIENNQWDLAVFGDDNSWDPNEPMILIPGQSLYFYYSDPTSDNTPPNATIWLRYDPGVLGLVLCHGKTRTYLLVRLLSWAPPEACLSTLLALVLIT